MGSILLILTKSMEKCFVKKSNFVAKLFTNIIQVQQIATALKFPSQSCIYFEQVHVAILLEH